MATQYFIRAQKTTALVESPSWEITSQIPPETAAVRCSSYSFNGQYFAYATSSSVQLISADSSSTSTPKTISQTGVVALSFSPLSTTLFTFERPVKSDNDVHRNVKAWSVETGEEVGGWYQKTYDDWEPVITADEAHLFRPTSSDLLIFSSTMAPRPTTRLKVDGQIKGLFLSRPTNLPEGTTSTKPLTANPESALAVWLGEKKGAPASVALYPVNRLVGTPKKVEEGEESKTETRDMPLTTARKAFYKADKLSVRWNNAGTMALFLTQSDVDSSGKSYYGETNLYLVSLDGSFDGMVDLDKEGPIYDFVWSPTSREFTVCYGYMPARVQLFDLKTKPVHSFGSQHRNFLLYQPQGKLLLSGGFGNLAGGVDIWDVSTRNKVAEFKASNSSHCEWSPCGRYILTATLSPRLRVDNGVKIWWCGGQLLHVHLQDDLYQAGFQRSLTTDTPSFPGTIPAAPAPNASVAEHGPKNESSNGAPAAPRGAYRPPGARGQIASDAYARRDDEHSSGTSTPVAPSPMFRGGKPVQRYVPGQGVPGAPASATPGAGVGDGDKEKKKRTRSKKTGAGAPVAEMAGVEINGEANANEDAARDAGADEEANAKRVRNLVKKLKNIEELKTRLAGGEVLEKTQVKKIETEGQVKAEIESLGGSI